MTEDYRHWQDHQGRLLDSDAPYDIIDCETCGFKHVVPLPEEWQLESIYRSDYYSKEKPLYIERYREDLNWWRLVYSDRYETFEDLLAPHRRRILDIGSGPGFFLASGKQRGWTGVGIEPSRLAAEHSRSLGLEILEDFLNPETAAHLDSFDVIHMSEVLEHLPDPVQTLTLVDNLLNPEGLVCVVVPNDYNPFQKALRTASGFKPWWIAPPHHLNYFDFDSLTSLLEKTGFRVVSREATFPIDLFLLMGENYVGNDRLGRECHQKRKSFERKLAAAGLNELKRDLYRALAELGLGREAMIIAQKNPRQSGPSGT